MRVGIGLPTSTPGTSRDLLLEWSLRADRGPFSTLAVVDRIVYPNLEPFMALAAAAALTRRIDLATMAAIGPLRNTVLLAKQAASIDVLSGGRLTLGLAVGARGDDYDAAGIDHRGRGRRLGDQLEEIRTIWEEGKIGPLCPRPSGPRLLVGGGSGEAFLRMARTADGYMHGGGPPRAFAGAAARARAAWIDAGRPGAPLLWGMGYFALGEGTADAGAGYLRDYYAFAGPFAEKIAAANLIAPGAVADFVRGYQEAGCDELVLFPTVSSMDQLDRLAEVLS
jgi:alkanesulfonate monooxygenase SsuD/methylene tetrahydromethanopterin reductase-like flavin-dependent oxidoreductase (luciferase family)